MVLTRALFKEAATTTMAIGVVLIALIFFIGFTQAVGKVALGKTTSGIFVQLLALRMVGMADMILSLSLFLGVLFTVNRWYQDSEMTILSACGVSRHQLLKPVLLLALVIALLDAAATLYLGPMAERLSASLQHQQKESLSLAGIRSGVFNERGAGEGVIYAETIDNDTGQLNNIFVSSSYLDGSSEGKRGVIVAERGRHMIDKASGTEYLILEAGKSYEGVPGKTEFRIMDFGAYRLHISSGVQGLQAHRIKALMSSELWGAKSRAYQAELQWRIARPIATIILAVVALAMAYVAPRQSRFGNLFAAILVFFVYNNLLTVGASFLQKKAVSLTIGLWWIHGIFLIFSLYLLWRRANNKPLVALPWRNRS
ncbi:MAG: LPS export ABC transporter permease LptF [Gammaproteobacteria bacterium]|nr:LPS export ABC transporter permease LptF [Gammaproteobacteria bacterium]